MLGSFVYYFIRYDIEQTGNLEKIGQGVKELGAEYANVLFLFPFMKNSCAQAHAVGFRWITMAPPMLESAQRRR